MTANTAMKGNRKHDEDAGKRTFESVPSNGNASKTPTRHRVHRLRQRRHGGPSKRHSDENFATVEHGSPSWLEGAAPRATLVESRQCEANRPATKPAPERHTVLRTSCASQPQLSARALFALATSLSGAGRGGFPRSGRHSGSKNCVRRSGADPSMRVDFMQWKEPTPSTGAGSPACRKCLEGLRTGRRVLRRAAEVHAVIARHHRVARRLYLNRLNNLHDGNIVA